MDIRKRFHDLREISPPVSVTALDELFDHLASVTPEEILGEWKGGDWDTGHRGSQMLRQSQWFGKTFTSRQDAKPLICYNDAGELYSSQMMNGEASLWEILFRGKVSTTMVYDGVRVLDHFRKVDVDTLMGIMDGSDAVLDHGQHYYFYLERIASRSDPRCGNNSV